MSVGRYDTEDIIDGQRVMLEGWRLNSRADKGPCDATSSQEVQAGTRPSTRRLGVLKSLTSEDRG